MFVLIFSSPRSSKMIFCTIIETSNAAELNKTTEIYLQRKRRHLTDIFLFPLRQTVELACPFPSTCIAEERMVAGNLQNIICPARGKILCENVKSFQIQPQLNFSMDSFGGFE